MRSYEDFPVTKNSWQITEKYQDNPELRQHFTKINQNYRNDINNVNIQNFSFNQNYTYEESPTKNMKVLK